MYRKLFEVAGESIIVCSAHGVAIECNQAALDLFACTKEQLIGTSPIDWSPELQPNGRRSEEMAAEVFSRVKAEGLARFEWSNQRTDGLPLPVDVTVRHARIDGRDLFVVISRDITEYKSIEIALRESEHRIRSFFDNVPVGIFISTREGKFVYINSAMPRIMGYDSSEEMMDVVNRRSIAEVLYVDPPRRQALIAELDQKHTGWSFYENRYRCKDGRIITAEITISERIDEIAREPRFYGIVKDITERKQAEADLLAAKTAAESASQTKSRFLAAASHDLRQPMQAIGLFQGALARTDLNPEQRRFLDYLGQSTRSMGELLDALLDISKLDAGAVQVSREIIQAKSLVQQIDAEFAPLAANKSLRLKLSFPLRDMAMLTDGKLLMGLLRNLIGNAIKYTDKGGVLVAIRRRDHQALIQIWDTGIGIAGEHLDTIYEEYFQVGNAERDRSKGLGLGLAIARRIAKLLETEIRCHSRPGKGSVFEFRLPLATSGENAPSNQSDLIKVTPSAKPAGRHVVLVEDDLMVGTATKLALESCGMTVTRYRTAEEALADPDIAAADFYISDLRLPGNGGIEFLDAVQQRATKPVKAVMLTGDTAVNQIEMMRSTSWQVLFKPVDLASLLSVIGSQELDD